jgi:hypothetical protein
MLKRIGYIIPLLLIIVGGTLNAQNFSISNERTYSNLYKKHLDTLSNFHTSIQPFSQNEIPKFEGIIEAYTTKKGELIRNKHLIKFVSEKYSLSIDPIVNLGLTLEKNNQVNKPLTEASFGFNLKTSLGEKWSSQLILFSDYSKYPSHINTQVENKHISPGYGYSKNDRAIAAQADITFTADEYFTFQLGYGKNFIGDGYRSLLLSDNANSYPYLKLTANIWKIKYMALYTNYQDIRFSNGKVGDYFQKLSTIHYLSLNLFKWWNIGMFESIIWQAQEDNFYRGYDMNYFNPIILLRPTEYSQGSSDNALLGGSMKFKLKKKNIIYTQLILDEFLLSELKSGKGWWGNKYGYQIGIKSYDFLTLNNLTLQMEFNFVRPFTYTHTYSSTNISTLQNYGHFNAPLAHPLGANFKELMLSLTYQKKRWIFEVISTLAKVGLEANLQESIGQNIFIPNNNRANEYGYYTTQGLTTDIVNSTLKASYILNPKSQLILQAGITNRTYKNSIENTANNMIFIGLKTGIMNRYFDF